jgi:CBS domain-containing protein
MTNLEAGAMQASAGLELAAGVENSLSDLRARDVMAVELLTVDAAEGLLLVWELVSQAGVHHVPVFDDGRCIGLLAERDLALAIARNPLGDHRRLVRELVDEIPAFVGPEDVVADVATTLLQTGKDAVLVRTDQESLMGLITERDLLRALAGQVVPRAAGQAWDHAPTLFELTPVLPEAARHAEDPERDLAHVHERT